MQEITIILGSLAGIATAIAVRRRPKAKLQSLGANSQIREQITSLKIERDIITKTIVRLYENDEDFSKIQKDKLLTKYQHQLGLILTRIEKLEQASEHPDLGPVGDGLITLMDQKLSKLDDRLYELSSKIVSQTRESPAQPDLKADVQSKIETDVSSKVDAKVKEISSSVSSSISPSPNHTLKPKDITSTKPRQSFEITTLTNIPHIKPVETDISKLKEPVTEKPVYKDTSKIIPDVTKVKQRDDIKHEIVNVPVTSNVPVVPNIDKPKDDNIKVDTQESLPKIKPSKSKDTKQDTEPSSNNADLDDESLDDIVDDDEGLEKIQSSIDNILSEMNQAEVE